MIPWFLWSGKMFCFLSVCSFHVSILLNLEAYGSTYTYTDFLYLCLFSLLRKLQIMDSQTKVKSNAQNVMSPKALHKVITWTTTITIYRGMISRPPSSILELYLRSTERKLQLLQLLKMDARVWESRPHPAARQCAWQIWCSHFIISVIDVALATLSKLLKGSDKSRFIGAHQVQNSMQRVQRESGCLQLRCVV